MSGRIQLELINYFTLGTKFVHRSYGLHATAAILISRDGINPVVRLILLVFEIKRWGTGRSISTAIIGTRKGIFNALFCTEVHSSELHSSLCKG
jgi:hypothetical protein